MSDRKSSSMLKNTCIQEDKQRDSDACGMSINCAINIFFVSCFENSMPTARKFKCSFHHHCFYIIKKKLVKL